jgi:hypothetical protein
MLYERYIDGNATDDRVVLELVQRQALDAQNFGTASWAPNLDVVRWCYARGVVFEPSHFYRQRPREEPTPMPVEIAEEILNTPDQFPSFLLAVAEERCRQDVSSKITPVAAVAQREGWFSG